MSKQKVLCITLILSLLGTLSAGAHHNPGFYFDMRERVVHTNATTVSYTAINPHGRLIYTMADEDGIVKEWIAELPANNMMRRFGVDGSMIKPGDAITLMGNPGRNGATMLRVTHVLVPSGDVVTFYAPQGSATAEDLQIPAP
ncbi:MAG: hypothetical protein HOM55_04105 [Proteobacteria bacterium]|jgi:hypothetical protein|nr:hypothetical protein [Pseudomonadota bacterium]